MLFGPFVEGTRPWHICDALDDERAAYVHLREAVPDLTKPAGERHPLTPQQREAMLLWQAAEAYVHAFAGHQRTETTAR